MAPSASALLITCCLLRASSVTLDGVSHVQAATRLHVASLEAAVPADLSSQTTYAYPGYSVGEAVEGKTQSGNWVACTITSPGTEWGLYNVHVSDDYPGYDLPNVPHQMLRKVLAPGESDFLVDNSQLQHPGAGVKYRFSKNMDAKSEEYAPWGTLVVGADVGDGWIKASRGYLPNMVRGVPVLVEKHRSEVPTPKPAPRNATLELSHTVKDVPQPPAIYSIGEETEFRTKRGDYYPCRIVSPGIHKDTYNVVVLPSPYSVYPVNNVAIKNLRKLGRPTRVPQEGEPLACKKDGCILLKVRNEKQDKEYLLQVPKRSKLEMMMRMVCNKLRLDWATCQAQSRFKHNSEQLSPWTHLETSGLQDQDTVELEEVSPNAKEAASGEQKTVLVASDTA